MCDEHFEDDLSKYMRPGLTRRQFGAMSIGVGMAIFLPRAADALDVTESEVNVKTPDGQADCYFVHPSSGTYPGVIVWPDILGLRPAFRQMGKRLAESGYSVLVVNPFYRQKRAPVVPAGANFADTATRSIVMPLAQSLNATTHTTDAKAFVAFLDTQASVHKTREDRHHRLLHGRSDRDANRGSGSNPYRCWRDIPRRWPRHAGSRQPASLLFRR